MKLLPKYTEGDAVTLHRFAWLPTRVEGRNGGTVTVWLEKYCEHKAMYRESLGDFIDIKRVAIYRGPC